MTQIPITTVSILPGGTHRVWIPGARWFGAGGGGLGVRSGAEVAFTDRAGKHWIRRATGRLEPLPEDPITYFESRRLYGPHDLQTPERVT